MIWHQREFWATWLAWWIDGCPAPKTWWRMRELQGSVDRLLLLLGRVISPTVSEAMEAMQRALGS